MGAAQASPIRAENHDQPASGRDVGKHGAANDRENTRQKQVSQAGYLIHPTQGDPFLINVNGRIKWALERLLGAGSAGCTPLSQPAPRWSHYIHQLRGMGVEIETIHEPHGGSYPGHHGRYVLRSKVTQEGGGA